MVTVSDSTEVRRAPGALWRDLPESVLVLQVDDSVVRLTGPGRALWLVLEEPATVEQLEQAFVDSDRSAMVAGVRGYLGELEQLGLVTLGRPADQP